MSSAVQRPNFFETYRHLASSNDAPLDCKLIGSCQALPEAQTSLNAFKEQLRGDTYTTSSSATYPSRSPFAAFPQRSSRKSCLPLARDGVTLRITQLFTTQAMLLGATAVSPPYGAPYRCPCLLTLDEVTAAQCPPSPASRDEAVISQYGDMIRTYCTGRRNSFLSARDSQGPAGQDILRSNLRAYHLGGFPTLTAILFDFNDARSTSKRYLWVIKVPGPDEKLLVLNNIERLEINRTSFNLIKYLMLSLPESYYHDVELLGGRGVPSSVGRNVP
ncbi:uncharacterized protein BT62DRAFT_999487 [Guyanagaster necrorhizus]|uniref:Uncharacterized protein n=1 Tax=Guyanagaster necrorhizus TaxID=856835 RepID=A0A9P8AXH4_9AGAR|nr:uncharacterized protein BT62DRAFT_999487 [Guyanagaster necrorhizus MCA 3950]KAG7451789.1 hypothetical protein BT62DRAFT_999487 [Guyanagaster necrorhizus MCA 3950]